MSVEELPYQIFVLQRHRASLQHGVACLGDTKVGAGRGVEGGEEAFLVRECATGKEGNNLDAHLCEIDALGVRVPCVGFLKSQELDIGVGQSGRRIRNDGAGLDTEQQNLAQPVGQEIGVHSVRQPDILAQGLIFLAPPWRQLEIKEQAQDDVEEDADRGSIVGADATDGDWDQVPPLVGFEAPDAVLDEAEVKVSEEGGVGRLVLVQEGGDREDDSGGRSAVAGQ